MLCAVTVAVVVSSCAVVVIRIVVVVVSCCYCCCCCYCLLLFYVGLFLLVLLCVVAYCTAILLLLLWLEGGWFTTDTLSLTSRGWWWLYSCAYDQALASQDPSAMMDGMKNQIFMLVSNVATFFLVSWMFGGFLGGKMPFGLFDKFRPMFHRGIDMPLLDVSYVTPLSLYILITMGISGVISLFLGGQDGLSSARHAFPGTVVFLLSVFTCCGSTPCKQTLPV